MIGLTEVILLPLILSKLTVFESLFQDSEPNMIMTTCYTLLLAVIHVVSGKSWGDFVEERIMEPLEMNHSAASFVRLKDSTNIIAPHV
jgi:hypothetical protein